MSFSESGGWGHWHCGACDRDWLSGAGIANVMRLTPGAPRASEILAKAWTHGAPSAALLCPTCHRSNFGSFVATAATLDVCRECGGTHFGPGAYGRLYPPGFGETYSGGVMVGEAVAWALFTILLS